MQFDITPHPDLATAQDAAKAEIDAAAGRARARYITDVSGQSETYLLKAQDADAYKAAGYPADTTPYPWIAKEAQATGQTPQQAADAIIAKRDAWTVIGSQIEYERRNGKLSVESATTIAAAMRARDTAVSSLDAL